MMTKLFRSDETRVKELLAFSRGLINGENGKELIEKHKEAIDAMTPYDLISMESMQLDMGITPATIKEHIGKVMNVFFTALSKYSWGKPKEGSFLFSLMEENRALENRLDAIKTILKGVDKSSPLDLSNYTKELIAAFEELGHFEDHYVKKENILFPFLEKLWDDYSPLTVMWSIHDDIRKKRKVIIGLLQKEEIEPKEINRAIGEFFFIIYGMIQKEEYIVFPIASDTVPSPVWEMMHHESFEYSFPYIKSPEKPEVKPETPTVAPEVELLGFLKTATGTLSSEQAELMLNALPLDITLVDENDRVVYFSRPKDRFFPRSPSIIGRKVQNCHPPESVHIVEKIVSSFKNGEKDDAQFWFKMKGKYILISYYALRDEKGIYKGVLEASQEITAIQNIKGEKRLLDW
jgi:uncharacterized protein